MNRPIIRTLASLLCGLLAAAPGFAQPAPATTPPPAKPRFVMTPPPGFEKLSVAGHTAICEANDVKWVRQALTDLKPATRPTTMPADLLKQVTAARPTVVKQMVTDLALADDKLPNQIFDQNLIPTLTKLDALQPPVMYLIVTRDKLKEVCKAGWGAPRFHYNRVADDVSYSQDVSMSIDAPMDDSPLPAFYEAKDNEDARAKTLAAGIQQFDAGLASMVARQAQLVTGKMMMDEVGKLCFDPLNLPRDQKWLAVGATGYFGTKYAGQLTSLSRDIWLKEISYEDPRFPVSGSGIDLSKPTDESKMRPAAVDFYRQAMNRKAVRAVAAWAANPKGGEASVTKVIAAVRAKVPADGAAMVKLVQDVGGIDLTKEIGSK